MIIESQRLLSLSLFKQNYNLSFLRLQLIRFDSRSKIVFNKENLGSCNVKFNSIISYPCSTSSYSTRPCIGLICWIDRKGVELL